MPRRKLSGWWRARQLPCLSAHRGHLAAYLDGELNAGARAGVESHLAACPRCRAEYEQLRFASRALSHFVVPDARPAGWQVGDPRAEQPQGLSTATLRRFWALKLTFPAPVVAAVALAAIIFAGVLFVNRPVQTQTSAAPMSVEAPATQIKVIEVPVEREVVRERVVTRTIYARPFRATPGRHVAAGESPSAIPPAQRAATALRRATNSDREASARASLIGFRPAADVNLRIVKEPEQ